MQAGARTPRDEKGTLSLAGDHSPLEGESQKPSRQAPAEAVGGCAVAPLTPALSQGAREKDQRQRRWIPDY